MNTRKNTMKTATVKALAALLSVCAFAGCSHLQEFDDVDPVVHGAWSGEGRFYDRDLKDQYGSVAVSIEIHPDGSVEGNVGSAKLTNGVVKRRPEDHLIRAELDGPVFEDGSLPGEHKDCVVLILHAFPDGTADGDFHLKTNRSLDLTMRAGAITLARSRGDSPESLVFRR